MKLIIVIVVTFIVSGCSTVVERYVAPQIEPNSLASATCGGNYKLVDAGSIQDDGTKLVSFRCKE